MKRRNKFSAPGKLIISGEHSVVYGYPALVTAVNKRLTAERIGRRVIISSDIPVGVGMGSSAAYAAAISALRVGSLDLEKINAFAYKVEKRLHGNPSGVDNTICTYGGFLWFRKESENFKVFKNIVPRVTFPNIYLLNSGKPAESTKEMVKMVSDKIKGRKIYYDVIFKEIEIVTKNFLSYLLGDSRVDFGQLIKTNETLLEKLGVVSSSTKDIIRLIEKIGGYAKITGAGGKKGASGMLIVFHKNSNKLIRFAQDHQLEISAIKIGEGGIRSE